MKPQIASTRTEKSLLDWLHGAVLQKIICPELWKRRDNSTPCAPQVTVKKEPRAHYGHCSLVSTPRRNAVVRGKSQLRTDYKCIRTLISSEVKARRQKKSCEYWPRG